jgi:hypothetical protein
MTDTNGLAGRLLGGDPVAVADLARRPLAIRPDNLVARPWGGNKLISFKGLGNLEAIAGEPIGESFEIAADDADAEARQFPSQVRLSDGSQISLPRLLATAAPGLFGAPFVARHGPRFPLLPKLLNISELLSVQGHPAGNTEVYVVVAAEPGATLRLGFNRDMDAADMTHRLTAGRAEQLQLLAMLAEDTEPGLVQRLLAPALARRDLDAVALAERLLAVGEARGEVGKVAASLHVLHETYWWMLDSMNEIPVVAGQVIHNCNPARLVDDGGEPSAEVHALGNPEGREVLALEIRKPGPTFRAWDNVRFPIRDVDVAAAVAALNLRATAPEEFMAARQPVAGRPGVFVSVDSAYFRIEHLGPAAGLDVGVAGEGVHCLHGLGGAASLIDGAGNELGSIAAGESLLIPAAVADYHLRSGGEAAEIVKVTLPE